MRVRRKTAALLDGSLLRPRAVHNRATRASLAVLAVALGALLGTAPVTPATAAPPVPKPIAARDFALASDLTSYRPAVDALAAKLPRRTVSEVMAEANRDRQPLCNPVVYQPLAARSQPLGFCWEDGDDGQPGQYSEWWPQGITTTRDALDAGEYDGHQLVLVSWYHKGVGQEGGTPLKGVRVSFVDWDADYPNTYRHVLLVEPYLDAGGANFRPLLTSDDTASLHAGGIVWYGNLLYVADTSRGFRIFDLERMYEVSTGDKSKVGRQPDGSYHAFDYRYVLPQVGWVDLRMQNTGIPSLRFSFAALDRASTPDSLLVGEYTGDPAGDAGTGNPADPNLRTRVVRFPLDYTDRLPKEEADGLAYGSEAYNTGYLSMQGAVSRNGRFWFASSAGSSGGPSANYGKLRFFDRDTGAVREYSWAFGAEDLSYWPDPDGADYLWTLTEYPGYRVVVAVPQADFD